MARKKSRQSRAPNSKRGAARRAPRRSQRTSPSGSPSSTVREDLLAFARNLRANAKEAEKYSVEHIAKRLGTQATRNAETHFVTRTSRLAHELRARDSEFATLVARCLTPDPCRPIIDTLVSAGLQDFILTLASAVESIASRASHVIDGEARRRLDEDLAYAIRLIASLVEVASWITRKARVIGDEDMSATGRRVELPESLRASVQAANAGAAAFLRFLADRPPVFGRSDRETTLAWLRHVQKERERIEKETTALLAALSVFTDADLKAAEEAGGGVLVLFLQKHEDVVNEITATRNTSILITESVINSVIQGLSLHDGDGDGDGGGEESGLDAASSIIYRLDSVRTQLDEQKRSLDDMAQRTTAARMAATVEQADLPAWEQICGTGKRTDTGVKGIWMLLMAFQDPDAAKQTFTTATKKELLDRLNGMAIATRAKFSDAWVLRRLEESKEFGIVFMHPRVDGQSKTTPDRFQLSAAAIAKYRHRLAAR